MFFTKQASPVETFATQVSDSADHVVTAAQEAANEAIDSLAETVNEMRHSAAPVVSKIANTSHRANVLAHQSVDKVRDSVRHDPLKAILVSATAGAVLIGLLALATRTSHRR